MKHKVIGYYSMIVLLIGSVVLTSGWVNAQRTNHVDEIILETSSLGFVPGQTLRFSAVNPMDEDKSVRPSGPVTVTVRLLDMEGEVIAESDEIRELSQARENSRISLASYSRRRESAEPAVFRCGRKQEYLVPKSCLIATGCL